MDISAVSDLGEADFCKWLTTEIGVAAIPLSAFYGDGFDQRVVRFCFAKKDETLQHGAGAAGEALRRWSSDVGYSHGWPARQPSQRPISMNGW